jgi:hypothetical protein
MDAKLSTKVSRSSERVILFVDHLEHEACRILSKEAVASLINIKSEGGYGYDPWVIHLIQTGKGVMFSKLPQAPQMLPMMFITESMAASMELLLGYLVLIERWLTPHLVGSPSHYHNFMPIAKYYVEQLLKSAERKLGQQKGSTALELVLSPYTTLPGNQVFTEPEGEVVVKPVEKVDLYISSTTTMLLREEMASQAVLEHDPDYFQFESGGKRRKPKETNIEHNAHAHARAQKLVTALEQLELQVPDSRQFKAMTWHKLIRD